MKPGTMWRVVVGFLIWSALLYLVGWGVSRPEWWAFPTLLIGLVGMAITVVVTGISLKYLHEQAY